MSKLTTYQPYVLALLRMVTAYLFLLHGSAKLLGLPHVAMFDGLQLFSLYGLAGVLELVGGLFIFVGFLTRISAFLLSGQMAVAYFMAHASTDTVFLPLLNGGEGAVLFCFVFFYLVFSGAGALAIDNKLNK
ncbi:DoxX family protein [Spirabiliibacterium falconis]|uniref:DoxX family protein n=1 Tax=Spirabiliibacterium falconis TaxID=572023 RepID=UPI001AAD68FF|nr:DoxX family protein [Spirabiliibacterium falconis]MBE2894899.1 DoxX family protein [Spirabiliibacterium falconis]